MTPDLLPVLSRGKHRSARKGACFMEMASFLAGERWSDHPRCTHPLLGSVARMVNDATSDDARQELTRLIPAVIGTAGNDPRTDVLIARRAALAALPIAAGERQRVLAVGILACERVLADLDGRAPGDVSGEALAELRQVPDAFRWATEFSRGDDVPLRRFREVAAPGIVRVSVTAIAHACIADRDTALRELLEGVIAETARVAVHPPSDDRVLSGLVAAR
jgi:hypothetical protein